MRRVAHEQPFPHECFALPEESLAVLIHLGPEADLVEGAIELDLELRAQDEDDVAVARAADAFVADGFAGDLHSSETGQEIRDFDSSNGGTGGKGPSNRWRGRGGRLARDGCSLPQ